MRFCLGTLTPLNTLSIIKKVNMDNFLNFAKCVIDKYIKQTFLTYWQKTDDCVVESNTPTPTTGLIGLSTVRYVIFYFYEYIKILVKEGILFRQK